MRKPLDLTNQKFGRLTAIRSRIFKRKNRRIRKWGKR